MRREIRAFPSMELFIIRHPQSERLHQHPATQDISLCGVAVAPRHQHFQQLIAIGRDHVRPLVHSRPRVSQLIDTGQKSGQRRWSKKWVCSTSCKLGVSTGIGKSHPLSASGNRFISDLGTVPQPKKTNPWTKGRG